MQQPTKRVDAGILPGTPEAEAFETELLHLGRNRAPGRFLDAVIYNEISRDLTRELILDVWSGAELPLKAVGRNKSEAQELWRLMFECTGFVADSDDLPNMPMTVYRGVPVGKPRGFSWSWQIDTARWFANRYQLALGTRCGIYSVTLEQQHMLGVITEGRGECEVIADPAILTGELEPTLVQVMESPDRSAGPQPLNTV
jgi:hypothetical protein